MTSGRDFLRASLSEEYCLRRLGGGDDTGEREAGFGEGGDVVGEGFGGFGAADDEGAQSGLARFHGEVTDGADGGAEKQEQEEVGDDGVERHNADGKEIKIKAEAVGDDGHDADDGDEEEATVFGPAVAAEENGLAVEAEGSE